MSKNREELLVILGPTASGKTSFSVNLSKYFQAEIISADSMQVYRDMDIGTDKIDKELQKLIPHHLLDIISPEEEFSVAEYKEKARKKIAEISSRDNIPVMVGGTGLYIRSVLENYTLPDLPDDKIRNKLKDFADRRGEKGRKMLHARLRGIDPAYARKIHHNDVKRVTRALEVFYLTGKTRTYYGYLQSKMPPPYRDLKLGIWRKRQKLYDRIDSRVEEMFDEGLLEEVKTLREKYNFSKTAGQALGYKELFSFLEGEINLDEAKELIKKRTRRLAKKQISFFKRDKDIVWFNPDDWQSYEDCLLEAVNLISKSFDSVEFNFKLKHAGI
ncbi:tRNA (adenosine(37)-N6)-dimethylallyltransferase MiaA [Halarsenatibacter silvermanii]|uniref:tRNA dimethylallyltransferase n=1 Tax=Halarsenatibacter silvermanii TaxID=321763 RepID=A0A1G9P006_9FIRM|nr:tRNA (adenosine(37)-N6)-dimethylallyltransferase MiaA [Halarsenatibacter silvermanii]SDL91587.1 tRNA dimethylallyltransferase [Halarsenatibacter silvermanii]